MEPRSKNFNSAVILIIVISALTLTSIEIRWRPARRTINYIHFLAYEAGVTDSPPFGYLLDLAGDALEVSSDDMYDQSQSESSN